MEWLKRADRSLFVWCNQRLHHTVLDWLFGWVTHLGGATFTILSAVVVIVCAPDVWSAAGRQSLVALATSHGVAVIIKKKAKRDRPFRALYRVRVGKYPLPDYSFPSGHSTAIFACTTPYLFLSGLGAALLMIALAGLVAFSRVYWGYHYPTDCAAGGAIGTGTALLTVYAMN